MKYLISILSILLLNSCTIYGLTSDYNKLTSEQQSTIVPLENFDNVDNQHIYKINGQELKQELKKHPKSLVYIFSNGCTSEFCLPMSNYERFAKENDFKLFLVMNGYGNLYETTKQRSEVFTKPLYSVDGEFYETKFNDRYTRFFENELRGIPKNSRPKWEGSLYFFEYDQFKKVTRKLPN